MRIHASLFALTLLVAFPLNVSADSYPKRKTGLWETTAVSGAGLPPQLIKECVDEATDAEMMKMGSDMSKSTGGACSKQQLTKTSAGFETNSECKVGNSTMRSTVLLSGDFTSSYAAELTTTMTPPLFGQGTSKTSITAKYLGACGPDMKPGDVLMDNGMKMNSKAIAAQTGQMAGALTNSKSEKLGADLAQAMAEAQRNIDPAQREAMREAMQQMAEAMRQGGGQ